MRVKTTDSSKPLRLDLLMFMLWQSGQWAGIRVLPDSDAKTFRHTRTRTPGASVHFYTFISVAWGEPFGTRNTIHLLPWRVGQPLPGLQTLISQPALKRQQRLRQARLRVAKAPYPLSVSRKSAGFSALPSCIFHFPF